jgi:hypothetical protein
MRMASRGVKYLLVYRSELGGGMVSLEMPNGEGIYLGWKAL